MLATVSNKCAQIIEIPTSYIDRRGVQRGRRCRALRISWYGRREISLLVECSVPVTRP